MSTVHDPQLVERLADTISPIERSHAVYEWPDDEAAFFRTCDYRSFSDRGEQLDRFRCRKVVTQILDALAAEGRLTAQPEPEPAGVRPWDVKDGCW